MTLYEDIVNETKKEVVMALIKELPDVSDENIAIISAKDIAFVKKLGLR